MVSLPSVLCGSDKPYQRYGQYLNLVNLDQLEVKLYGPLSYGRYLEQKGSAEVYFNEGRTLLPVRALIAVSDERSQTFSAYLQIPASARAQFDIGQVVSVRRAQHR